MADDFNHWLPEVGYYPAAITPNLSALARQGVLFADASATSAHCAPSRQAIWSGVSPLTTGIDRETSPYIRDLAGYENVVTMNQLFTDSGYYTYAGGKLYHNNTMGPHITDPEHWTALTQQTIGTPAGDIYGWRNTGPFDNGALLWGGYAGTEESAPDTKLARTFAAKIKAQPAGQPFFMALGFMRPHLPWNAPVKYFDMYNPATLPIPQGYLAGDTSDTTWWEHTRWTQIQKEGQWKNGLRGYLASISYTDFNVGIVLDALRNSQFANNTIVVFLGDHGYMLGEKEWWDKYHVQDQANRTTLIIYDPTSKGNGQVSRKVVSLLDIYPTLAELAGLPKPATVQGNSLVPLLEQPNRSDWDKPVFLRFRSINMVKTNQWRYVQYGKASQLYDITKDPYEWTNLMKQQNKRGQIANVAKKLDELIASKSSLPHENP